MAVHGHCGDPLACDLRWRVILRYTSCGPRKATTTARRLAGRCDKARDVDPGRSASASATHGAERGKEAAMAAIPTISSNFLPCRSLFGGVSSNSSPLPRLGNPKSCRIRAAKLPAGVEAPKVEPKLTAPFLGFTRTAEVWNSRACMIGIVGTFIVELILNKGILQLLGVDVGKGLDLPL
ncbi:One helix protein [Musa troglodytarum]|uniref:One helix protein n=1 Tax=Musa troglodytarum TaxID=320322 RepID=A0A9E7I6Q6_9LILI|nr:One helix protein [Musa troglodytarum]